MKQTVFLLRSINAKTMDTLREQLTALMEPRGVSFEITSGLQIRVVLKNARDESAADAAVELFKRLQMELLSGHTVDRTVKSWR